MATYTAVPLEDAQALGAAFGKRVSAIEPLVAGSVNSNFRLHGADGESIFLRLYEEQDAAGAAGEIAILDAMSKVGIPVAKPLSKIDGRGSLATFEGKAVALFPWISGISRCQKAVTASDAFAVGAALARVHLVPLPAPRPSRFAIEQLFQRCDHIEAKASPELASEGAKLRSALRSLAIERAPIVASAPRGLTHGDLFRDNVLWEGPHISALLDFESAAEGTFAFDLSVTLLAWCYGDDFDLDRLRSMVQGYQSVRPLEVNDRRALYVEARLAALRFATTRVTDYAMKAHLGVNIPRDFRRFLARLAWIEARGERGFLEALGLAG